MRLKRIYIEITNTCNLSCSFCIQNQRAPRRMNVQEFRHVIQEIRPFTKYVYLHVLGEPLSHPNLKEFLNICEEFDLYVNLTTNGTLLKQARDVLINSRLRQVNVSLHSFPEHEQPQYLEHVFAVCEELAQKGVHISYRLWSVQNGRLSKESAYLLQVLTRRYQIAHPQEFERRMRMDLQEYLHLHLESVFTWPSLAHPYVSDTGRCLGMKQMCAILSDGTVVPCCLDSDGTAALGNIFTQPFSSILHGERAMRIQKGFDSHKVVEELCQHCSYRLRFSK
ncbi:radical SAM protein [[Clostridium] innocuum]|nr:radical SAM protein [[Clostridium] innocuum]